MYARIVAVGFLAVCFGVQAEAADLAKIKRSILSEPTYVSNAPSYCLLVFGPNADTRVWLVRNGDSMFVDRNGNGDLTEAGEQVLIKNRWQFHLGDIIGKDGKTACRDLNVYPHSSRGYRIIAATDRLGRQYVGFGLEEKCRFSKRPEEAPIVHFDGPLAIAQYATTRRLPRNPGGRLGRNTSLRVMVGTPGLGKGTFAAVHCRSCRSKGTLLAEFSYATESNADKRIKHAEHLKFIG